MNASPWHPPSWLFRFHTAVATHPWRTLICCLLVLGASGLLARRTRLDDNVSALLPSGPGSPGEAATLLSEFGALDTLLFDLSWPGASTESLLKLGDTLVEKLHRSDAFANVYSGPQSGELMKLGTKLLPKRLYLLENPKAELEARLAPDRLSGSLAALKESLMSPHALGLKQQLLADPLGLNNELFAQLAQQGGKLRVEQGHLLSQDGAHLLVITTPKKRALDVDASQTLMEEMADVAQSLKTQTQGQAQLRWVGGPRFAAESAGLIREDVADNFILSSLIMLVVFVLRFRGLRLLLLTSLPLVFGVSGAVAVIALTRGHIHGMTLGFGAALIGISMDYPLHLVNRAAAEEGERTQAYARTTRAVFQGLCLGFFTTAMGFIALFFSEFPALRELALFSGIGLVLAFVTNFLIVPPLCARLGPKKPSASTVAVRLLDWALPRPWALAVTVMLLALGIGSASGLVFDGDLRKLDSQRPQTLKEHDEVLALFGQPSSSSLVVSPAKTEQEALATNDAVLKALQPLEKAGRVRAVTSVASFIPSVRTQKERAASLMGWDITAARARLTEASEAAGFSAQAFDGFWKEVEDVAHGKVPPLAPADLEGTSLGLLLSKALRCDAQSCRVATPFERTEKATLEGIRAVLPSSAQLVDSEALAAKTVAEIPRQLALLCLLGVVGNVAFLWWMYRSLRWAVLTCLPCAIALVCTVGIMAAAGIPLNLVSAGGLVLVFGCGVDYGIFSLEGLVGEKPDGVEQLGVLLAAFTTLAGFGTLALAQNGAMRSLGLSTGLGTALSAAVALFLLPGLASRKLPAHS